MKQCTRCKDEFPLSEYKKNERFRDVYKPECKFCRSERAKISRKKKAKNEWLSILRVMA